MKTITDDDKDRGWAYAVAFSAFIVNLLAFGLSLCNSIFYVTFLDEFNGSAATTSWIVTMNTCSTMIFCPLGSVLRSWFPPRILMVIGAILSSGGLILTSITPNLYLLFITHSLLTGFGWSLNLLFIAEFMSAYFTRLRRVLVTLATTGLALGQFVFPPLFLFLERHFHWRGTLLIFAGINLHLIACAAAMMPPRSAPMPQQPEKKSKFRIDREVEPLKDWRFVLFLLNAVTCGVGYGSVQTHIGSYARIHLHTSDTGITFLASCIGLGGFAGRLLIPVVAHMSHLSYLLVYISSFVIAGVVTALCAVINHFETLAILSVTFGVCASAWGLFVEVIVEIVGLSQITQALGIGYFFSAFGVLLGGPVAAWLLSIDESYRTSFIVSGTIVSLGSFFSIPAYIRSRRKKIEGELIIKEDELETFS